MSLLNLSIDEVLTTTRAVRKRLDLSRPVEPEVIRECLHVALQAPTASNSQGWHFVVVTDRQQRQALAEIYRKGLAIYRERVLSGALTAMLVPERGLSREVLQRKMGESSVSLAEHLHQVPVLIVPCLWGRAEALPGAEQAGFWGSIMPAVWSFMLAARARGLGSLPYNSASLLRAGGSTGTWYPVRASHAGSTSPYGLHPGNNLQTSYP